MKQSLPTIARFGAALAAGLCVLALHPDARLTRAAALQDKPPVFSEVPAQSTPPEAPRPAAPLSPQEWIAPLKKQGASPARREIRSPGAPKSEAGTPASSPAAASAQAGAGSVIPAASPPAASPVVTQPAVVQPVVTQPVVVQPVVTTQPVVTQPVVIQPVATGAPASAGSAIPPPSLPPPSPPAASPVVVQPVVVQPVVVQPVVTPPVVTPPVVTPPVVVTAPAATSIHQSINPSIQQAEPAVVPPAAAALPEAAVADQRLYECQANGLDLRAALAIFGRANHLNIVPDNDVSGFVTLDVHDLPLPVMMRALLEASDCSWSMEGGLIRVRTHETRIFHIDYLRLTRKGIGFSSATLGSGASGGGGGMGGGGGGMGGGGGGMGGGGGGQSGGGGGGQGGGSQGGSTGYGSSSSSINLVANNQIDFWKEIVDELRFMLTPVGQSTLSINMTAGIIQITDRPSAIKRVEKYLSGVGTSIHRQVEIEARIYDVTLNDQFQFGIDWVHLAEAYGGTLGFGGALMPIANGGGQFADSTLGGINRFAVVGTPIATTPGGNPSTLVFQNFNTTAAVNAMQQQGSVEVISTPRIRTLNNQTALIKVGEDVPFFNAASTLLPGTAVGTSALEQNVVVSTVTIGTILSITPQVSEDDWISLDISPVLTRLNSVVTFGSSGASSGGSSGGSGGSGATAPDLDTKQASTLVRVRDGNTVVLGGLIQTQKAKNETKIPVLGDIPYLGKVLFSSTFRYNQKVELVIFVTPHIIRDAPEHALLPADMNGLPQPHESILVRPK